jgi:hypothetical protein
MSRVENAIACLEEYARQVVASAQALSATRVRQIQHMHAHIRALNAELRSWRSTAEQALSDNAILASALMGRAPDLSTQTADQVAATRAVIEAAIARAERWIERDAASGAGLRPCDTEV